MNTLANPLRNKVLRGNVKKDEESYCGKCNTCYPAVMETQIETAVINAGDHFQSVYLEYVNDYLTISAFALDKNMTEKQARQQIEIGRKIHNQRTSK